tara:strand:- start:245 stop:835 length:591 start_codon:yes stop_codon:yes gene_type:complete
VSKKIKLVIGLGNPGNEHAATRHNVGFWFVDALAEKLSLKFSQDKKFQSDLCHYKNDNNDCWICKPMTYMNESGSSVQALVNFYKLDVDQILVVHDEIDLNIGNIRFKIGGGHGGNNGVRDIINKLGNSDFNRLRIGVGHPGDAKKVTSYVLGKPTNKDKTDIIIGINIVIDNLDNLFAGQIKELMNQNNKRNKVS